MSIGVKEIKSLIKKLCDVIIKNEVYFCELDSVAGDGDFGMSLAKGFKQIKKQLEEIDLTDAFKFLRGCGMIISEHCGGASGPIWGAGFSGAAGAAKGKSELHVLDVAQLLRGATELIMKRGGAKAGDKTLLDALLPAVEGLEAAAQAGVSFRKAFALAKEAATAGAERTKNMVATRGRASYLGERSLQHPDAGAMAVAIIFTELCLE